MFCPLHFTQKHKEPFGAFPKRLRTLTLLNPIHNIYASVDFLAEKKYEKLVDLVQEMVEVLLFFFKTRLKLLSFFFVFPFDQS